MIMTDSTIQELISNSQSTHKTVAVNSIAMALRKLMFNYNITEITSVEQYEQNDEYNQCVARLSSLTVNDFFKANVAQDPILVSEINANLSSVIQYIIAKTKEPFSYDFDIVTIYNGTTDERVLLPLGTVFILIVTSIYDHQKFAHSYQGTEEECLLQATADLPMRLLSLFKCLQRIKIGICHTGIRHE